METQSTETGSSKESSEKKHTIIKKKEITEKEVKINRVLLALLENKWQPCTIDVLYLQYNSDKQ